MKWQEMFESMRDSNGVKLRADGAGDGWANAHRKLPREFYLQDLDGVFGMMAFGQNTAERLFIEPVPDSWENRTKRIRRFAYVAMFDRKTSLKGALDPRNDVPTAIYLHLCRELSKSQPTAVRFFYVVGDRADPPWFMVELDIETAEECGERHVINLGSAAEMRDVWRRLGLDSLRQELRKWIDP